jgi:hypothetical protein
VFNIQKILFLFFINLSLLLSESLNIERVSQGYSKPVYLTAPKNQSDTLFIIEQRGK